jgi:hypothetical protein
MLFQIIKKDRQESLNFEAAYVMPTWWRQFNLQGEVPAVMCQNRVNIYLYTMCLINYV